MASARDRWLLAIGLSCCAAPLFAQGTTVPADSITLVAPVGTLSELLNGRVPGLVVQSQDGTTGAGSRVVIRGETQPLVFIDGIRVDNDPGRGNLAASDHPAPGRLDDLDPSEIAGFVVLPGASAAALYGPDAGNGAIFITTKHAAVKSRGFITAEGAQVTTPVYQSDNYYAWGHQGTTPVQCLTYMRASGQCTLDSVTHFNPLPATLETVYQTRLGATVEGTSPTQRLFLTGHWLNDPGPIQMPGSDAAIYSSEFGVAPSRAHTLPNRQQQGDIRGAFGIDLAKTASADVTLGYVSRYQRDPVPNTLLEEASVGPGYDGAPFYGWRDSTQRPWNALADVARENARHLNGGVNINWRPNAAWTTHLIAGTDAVDQTAGDMGVSTIISTGIGAPGRDTTIAYDHRRQTQYTVDADATFNAGDSAARSATTFGLQYLAEHFHDSTYNHAGFNDLFSTDTRTIAASSQDRSAYAREALTLANHLVLAGGLRYDQQRYRGANLESWTLNPTFDVSWALVGSAADPRLRIRGAMGQTSTLPDARQSVNLAEVPCPQFSLCEPNYRAERQREYEAGFDASLPQDRWTIGFSIYSRRNVHALIPIDSVMVPQAITTDRGVEFSMGAKLVDNKSFGWDFAVAASQNTNKVIQANDFVDPFGLVGHPADAVNVTRYSYADANHDGVIEPSEVTVDYSAQYFIGTYTPTHLASASTAMQLFHRHLRLATLFDYRGGYVLPDNALYAQGFAFNAQAINAPGASLAEQAAAIAAREGVVSFQRVSALRWRELSATVGTAGPHSLQLTVAVRNLRLWSGYHGDPDWYNSGFAIQFPEPRTWLLRVTAGF